MAKARRVAAVVLVAACALAALALAGCQQQPPELPAAPKIAPPVIKQSGVLLVGVDFDYPPFAGTADGRQAGLDLDVASAIAGKLGLAVRAVDVKASQVATALSSGDVDIALSAPFSADVLSRATVAGTYITDGPALFTARGGVSVDATKGLDALAGAKVGAQQGSESYWLLVDQLGPDAVTGYPTLREAFNGLAQGQVDYVGADALVGAYIARDLSGIRYAGPLGPAHLLGVAVKADDTKLADTIRQTLDSLAADGALEAIRAKWVGALPKLPLAGVDASSPSSEASATP